MVFNKTDQLNGSRDKLTRFLEKHPNAVAISATTGQGIPQTRRHPRTQTAEAPEAFQEGEDPKARQNRKGFAGQARGTSEIPQGDFSQVCRACETPETGER